MLRNNRLLSINGAFGEGGGQILRSSVTLSAILGKPVRIYNIRSRRRHPGLKHQHFSAVKAVAQLCNARVENLEVGSDKIVFIPNRVSSNLKEVNIGSAGSITLILQAIIPVAIFGNNEIEVKIIGGSYVKWSPTLNYFRFVIIPIYRAIGIDIDLEVIKRGYYPVGGGIIKIRIKPVSKLNNLNLFSSIICSSRIISVASLLPKSVAERQIKSVLNYLSNEKIDFSESTAVVENSCSPGTSLLIYMVNKNGPFIGADSIGEKGKPSEKIGQEVAEDFLKILRVGAPIDSHIGDMIVPLLSLVKKESVLFLPKVTEHLITNLYISQQFTSCQYKLEEASNGAAILKLKGLIEIPN
jgi:RNA 3'-phosphate cyclase